MLISVIIPCYNNSQTIERALRSVINQTRSDFEVLVIDDASKDVEKTQTVIDKINDPRIKLLRHTINKNGAAARNTGIKAAQGQLIAFLDADDEWLPNHLNDSITFIKKSNVDFSYCQSIIKTTTYKDLILPQKELQPNERIGDYLFCHNGYIPTPSFVFKKEKVCLLFNPSLKRHQDYDFLLRAEAKNCKIAMSPHIGVVVHWENNNPAAKGGTWEYSLKWVKEYQTYMSANAKSNFIYKNVIVPLFQKKQRLKGLSIFISHGCFLYLSLKQWPFFFSWLLTGKIIFNRIKK